MYEYKAQVIRVIDGDTFELNVDMGFHCHIHIRARMLDTDTPECRTKDPIEKELGLMCADIARHLYSNQEVIIKSEREEADINNDSFGRWLVHLRTNYDDIENEDISILYNKYGMNKKSSTYNPEAIRKLWKELSNL